MRRGIEKLKEPFVEGSKVRTEMYKDEITVKSLISDGGGQGWVYKVVNSRGEEKAMKWYKPGGYGVTPEAFRQNMMNNIIKGAPSDDFLWPLDLTEWQDGSFGYIMDLIPDGYYEIARFSTNEVCFNSFKTVVDAELKIANAYRILHTWGYSYQDLNSGNFFINPDTGDVKIVDNDNVAPNDTNMGILGTPGFMAPEVVSGKSLPNMYSDLFSMAVIFYLLLTKNHPLEGKRYFMHNLPPEAIDRLYGEDALFILDREDDRNGIIPELHQNTLLVWNKLPQYMKDIFYKAFSKEALHGGAPRPWDHEWVQVLMRLRNDIVECENCGNDVFTCDCEGGVCGICDEEAKIPFKLDLGNYCVPAVEGTVLYKRQLGVLNIKTALDVAAKVLCTVNGRGEEVLVIKNLSGDSWISYSRSGREIPVKPEKFVPVIDGVSFKANNGRTLIKIMIN